MTNSDCCLPDRVLTVIVPVFNEEATIREVLGRVVAAAGANQVIVVDDGSTDGTGEIVNAECGIRNAEFKKAEGEAELILLRHTVNRGKGAAIRSGLVVARGEFVVIQDADLEYEPADIPRLIEPLVRGEADVVYGSRYLKAVKRRETRVEGQIAKDAHSWSFRWGVRLLNWVVRVLYGVRLTDEATCYKVFRREDLLRMDLECERFEFCPEVTAKACRMGLRIVEVAISYSPRGRKDGKKIRWRDGVAAVRELWRWRKWRPAPASLGASREARPQALGAATQALGLRRVQSCAPPDRITVGAEGMAARRV